jgi:hypothetical protein
MATQPLAPPRPSSTNARRSMAPLYFRGLPASWWQDALARRRAGRSA